MGMAVGGKAGGQSRYQYDADDRRAAGADHHFHGDHTADAEGTGGSGAAAAQADQPQSQADQRTVVIVINRDKSMTINQEATDEQRLGAAPGRDFQDARRARGFCEGRYRTWNISTWPRRSISHTAPASTRSV